MVQVYQEVWDSIERTPSAERETFQVSKIIGRDDKWDRHGPDAVMQGHSH